MSPVSMLTAIAPSIPALSVPAKKTAHRVIGGYNRAAAVLVGFGLCAVPMSIAIAESFLALALLCRVVSLVRRRAQLDLPTIFWYWLGWAALEIAAWLHSSD